MSRGVGGLEDGGHVVDISDAHNINVRTGI